MNNYRIRNGKELTESEYINYLEGLAYGVWCAQQMYFDGSLGQHSKSYDPLYIESFNLGIKKWIVHSYVFDFIDGGRHHEFDSLEQIETELIKEVQLIEFKGD